MGTPRGLEGKLIPSTKWRLEKISIPSLLDKQGFSRLQAGWKVIGMGKEIWKMLKRENPQFVFGTGGYASGPMVGVAALQGIPTAILEPNAMFGFTNRLLSRFVKRIFTAFPSVAGIGLRKKVRLFGVPVRQSLVAAANAVQRESGFVLLVFGGSQGARSINEALLGSLAHLQDYKDAMQIVHQVGPKEDVEKIAAQYRQAGVSAEVHPFIHNMGLHYGRAHFVVARAGAATVAELMAVRRPSLLIPYPHAAQNHQKKNAGEMVRLGIARLCEEQELTPVRLAQEIRWALENRPLLAAMEEKMSCLPSQEASQRIVNECLKSINISTL